VPSITCTIGGPMIDWGIIVAMCVVGVIAWAIIDDRLTSAIHLRRLKSQGRSISASEAIEEYENGRGVLVRNKSLLPGNWWLLRNKNRPNDYDLVTAMNEFGYVVVCKNAKERQAIEDFKGKVEEMLEPFD